MTKRDLSCPGPPMPQETATWHRQRRSTPYRAGLGALGAPMRWRPPQPRRSPQMPAATAPPVRRAAPDRERRDNPPWRPAQQTRVRWRCGSLASGTRRPRRQSEGSCDQSNKEGADLTRADVVGRQAGRKATNTGSACTASANSNQHRNPRLMKLRMMPITIMVVASETQV
jgi:hypothetical protein